MSVKNNIELSVGNLTDNYADNIYGQEVGINQDRSIKVKFMSVSSSLIDNSTQNPPQIEEIISTHPDIFINYNQGGNDNKTIPFGYSAQSANWDKISILRREIWVNNKGEMEAENKYTPVILGADKLNDHITDYNVANNRTYEYLLLPTLSVYNNGTKVEVPNQPNIIKSIVTTKWDTWSLTELHPVNGDPNKYMVNIGDIWLLKYNIQANDQSQNLSKAKQENLSAFPKFVHGLQNNISGTVSCLLGSQIMPYEQLTRYPTISLSPEKNDIYEIKQQSVPGGIMRGGYTESMPFTSQLTSNAKIDMIKAWRKICYSGNPKLLKDTRGQKFLVQIFDAKDSINQSVYQQPDTISFSWQEIGDLTDVVIVGEGEEHEV